MLLFIRNGSGEGEGGLCISFVVSLCEITAKKKNITHTLGTVQMTKVCSNTKTC